MVHTDFAGDEYKRQKPRSRQLQTDNEYDVPCAVKRRWFSAGAIPAWQLSLQPVATGAVVEATKPLKPPVERVARGDLASTQAVT
jgi:hypothetical protein